MGTLDRDPASLPITSKASERPPICGRHAHQA
jgi:hypothetical protein